MWNIDLLRRQKGGREGGRKEERKEGRKTEKEDISHS
jgi:hypothetical protein